MGHAKHANRSNPFIPSGLGLGVALLAATAAPGQPARHDTSQTAQTDPITPSSVMGDKDRSGPDGWVQAPVTRDAAPAQKAKAAGEPRDEAAQAASGAAKTVPASAEPMPAGEDPGTPMTPATGPGQLSSAPKAK